MTKVMVEPGIMVPTSNDLTEMTNLGIMAIHMDTWAQDFCLLGGKSHLITRKTHSIGEIVVDMPRRTNHTTGGKTHWENPTPNNEEFVGMGMGYQAQPLNYQRAFPGPERLYSVVPQGYAQNPRKQVIGVLKELYGPCLGQAAHLAYRKPYPKQIDRDYEFPQGYKTSLLFQGKIVRQPWNT